MLYANKQQPRIVFPLLRCMSSRTNAGLCNNQITIHIIMKWKPNYDHYL